MEAHPLGQAGLRDGGLGALHVDLADVDPVDSHTVVAGQQPCGGAGPGGDVGDPPRVACRPQPELVSQPTGQCRAARVKGVTE